MDEIKTYVLGLAFSESGGWFLTIEKSRPEWQAGKMNGIGGKIEPFEMSVTAMVREFKEETGIDTEPQDWTHIGVLEGTDFNGGQFIVYVYSMFNDEVHQAYTATDELVRLIPTCELDRYQVLPNIKWLVPMALNHHEESGISRIMHFTVRYA